MKREDDEQLWEILGRTAEPKPSPFFARNVLRRIREELGWSTRLRSWFTLRRLAPVSALAAALVAALIVVQNPSWREEPPATEEPDLLANIDPQDYEVVADLDELLALDENNPWEDDSSSL
jgi:hypothetical protein